MRRSKRDIAEQSSQNIFTPGIYHGSDDPDYQMSVKSYLIEEIGWLIRKRAKEDGQWCIDMGLVGNNEDRMRQMMAFVSDPENIDQCVRAMIDNDVPDKSIDFACRDLANASKWRS